MKISRVVRVTYLERTNERTNELIFRWTNEGTNHRTNEPPYCPSAKKSQPKQFCVDSGRRKAISNDRLTAVQKAGQKAHKEKSAGVRSVLCSSCLFIDSTQVVVVGGKNYLTAVGLPIVSFRVPAARLLN